MREVWRLARQAVAGPDEVLGVRLQSLQLLLLPVLLRGDRFIRVPRSVVRPLEKDR